LIQSDSSTIGSVINPSSANALEGGERNVVGVEKATEAQASHVAQKPDNVSSPASLDELKTRARNIAMCIRRQNQKRIAATLLAQSIDNLNDYARTRLDQNLQLSSAQIAKLEGEGACSGLNSDTLNGDIYPLLLDMARHGDAEAAACYVAADFDLDDSQLQPDAIEEYRHNAEVLIRDEMRNGDWRIVELLEAANDRDGDPHRGRYSWFREISKGNPALAYGYNRLIRLGATDSYAAQIDRALEAQKAELSPAQIAEQDAWADQEFKLHFAHSAALNEYAPTCSLYSDRRKFHDVLRSRG
jgi:hypothetical protein